MDTKWFNKLLGLILGRSVVRIVTIQNEIIYSIVDKNGVAYAYKLTKKGKIFCGSKGGKMLKGNTGLIVDWEYC
jgi:hypothetical protein